LGISWHPRADFGIVRESRGWRGHHAIHRVVSGCNRATGARGVGPRSEKRSPRDLSAHSVRSGDAGTASSGSKTARNRDGLRTRLGHAHERRAARSSRKGRVRRVSHHGPSLEVSAESRQPSHGDCRLDNAELAKNSQTPRGSQCPDTWRNRRRVRRSGCSVSLGSRLEGQSAKHVTERSRRLCPPVQPSIGRRGGDTDRLMNLAAGLANSL
jgi:hypothetical protein